MYTRTTIEGLEGSPSVSVGSGAQVLSAVQGAIWIAGRALALTEQVPGLFRSGCRGHCGAQVLFRECYRLLEAAARTLLDTVADEQRSDTGGDRAPHGKQRVADDHQTRADEG